MESRQPATSNTPKNKKGHTLKYKEMAIETINWHDSNVLHSRLEVEFDVKEEVSLHRLKSSKKNAKSIYYTEKITSIVASSQSKKVSY